MGNKLRLKEEHIGYLSNQPEQGMGYQIVDITLKMDSYLTTGLFKFIIFKAK